MKELKDVSLDGFNLDQDIEITDVKVSKDHSECRLRLKDETIDQMFIFNREMTSEEMLREVRNFIGGYHKGTVGVEEGDIILCPVQDLKISDKMKKEADEIVKDAQPMESLRIDPIVACQKLGFKQGVIVKCTDAFNTNKGYRILTGELYENSDGVVAKMTDGHEFLCEYCKIITDVNKEIFRTVSAEQGRIMEMANQACKNIDNFIQNVIYGQG
jgi:hypothetical protein